MIEDALGLYQLVVLYLLPGQGLQQPPDSSQLVSLFCSGFRVNEIKHLRSRDGEGT